MLWIGGLALGVGVVGGLWLRADAASDRVGELRALCERDRSYHGRAAALEELLAIDTSESRAALEALAGAKDDRLAVQALAWLSKSDHDGAKSEIEAVLADGKRSDLVRSAALASLCRREEKAGASWSDVESAIDAKSDGSTALDDMAAAQKDRLFAGKDGAK